jgi:cytochrome bd ubiquinol oxidase subunit I
LDGVFGHLFSSFWILANNSWMQVPVGHTIVDGKMIPAAWQEIVFGPVMRVRWPHMLLAAFLTTAMCVAATGGWYVCCATSIAMRRGSCCTGASDWLRC